MSASDPFAATPGDLAAFVREPALALVVSHRPDGVVTTPLPLLSEVDERGVVTSFFGHFALRNPQVALLRAQPRATLLFLGPHGYVPPRWVSKPDWAPTWNYALAQFDVEITLAPEENAAAIEALVAALEGTGEGSWNVERVGPRYAAMVQHVIAFHARVLSASGRFKLGQDESGQTFDEIVAALGDTPLARLMRRHRSRT